MVASLPARYAFPMILPISPFPLERHMLVPLAEGLPHLLGLTGTQRWRVLREPHIGMIIPDLLLGTWMRGRAVVSHPSTTLIDAHVRACIEREGWITSRQIVRTLHLSSTATDASLRRLVQHGLVTATTPADKGAAMSVESAVAGGRTGGDAVGSPSARWRLIPAAATTRMQLVAVEAKLTRWADAVRQAATYLSFADRAIVVLDGNQVNATDALVDAVRTAQVGLVLQHGRVLREIIPAPQRPVPLTADRVLAVTKVMTERGGRAFRSSTGSRTASARISDSHAAATR